MIVGMISAWEDNITLLTLAFAVRMYFSRYPGGKGGTSSPPSKVTSLALFVCETISFNSKYED